MNATAANPGITRIGQIAINVQDVERATAFYRDVLGLPLLFTAGQLAFFDCGGVRLMLSYPEMPEFDHPVQFSTSACPTSQPHTARCWVPACSLTALRTSLPKCRRMISGWPSSAIPNRTSWG